MLILLGLMTKSSTWLLAGVVLLICTLGLKLVINHSQPFFLKHIY